MRFADVDRLASKTRNGNVIDLDAYRATAGAPRSTAKPYASPLSFSLAAWAILLLAFFLLFKRG